METAEISQQLKEIITLLTTRKEVLSIDELCQFTGLTKSTIYKKTHTGQIPFYKQAKHLFFDRSEIIEWLKANRGFNAAETDSQAATYVTLHQGGKA